MSENPTIFGKILRGEIPAPRLWDDEHCIAIRDISPAAPHHLLILPKRFIATLDELEATDAPLLGHMVFVATQLAKQLGFAESGYRLVMNCGSLGGQSVFHIHLHLLGGRSMQWPPG
jgi:histidine triad (HIT) family protein